MAWWRRRRRPGWVFDVHLIPREDGVTQGVYRRVYRITPVYADAGSLSGYLLRMEVEDDYKARYVDLHRYDVRIHLVRADDGRDGQR